MVAGNKGNHGKVTLYIYARAREGCGLAKLGGSAQVNGAGNSQQTAAREERNSTMFEHKRRSAVGQFGEAVVLDHLAKDGYTCTRLGGHHRCFDILASKANKRYLVSVKSRNHTTHKNDEKKDSYNLLYAKKKGDDPDIEVRAAAALAQEYDAIPMWAAVRVDGGRQVYDIYHGLIDDLKNKKQIPMSPSDRLIHKKLADRVSDPRIDAKWSNVRSRKSDS